MSVFSEMLAEVFTSGLGVDAVYVAPFSPPGDPGRAVRVMPSQEDQIQGFGQTRVQSGKAVFTVLRSELATPSKDGILRIGTDQYTIKAPPRCEDPRRLMWTLECAAP